MSYHQTAFLQQSENLLRLSRIEQNELLLQPVSQLTMCSTVCSSVEQYNLYDKTTATSPSRVSLLALFWLHGL